MRRINTLRTLAVGSALILAIGTTACASEEESDEKGEPATVEATMSTEASEGTAASFAGSRRVWYRTVEIDGQTIFYREAGSPDAPTLVLLHGFPTSSHMFRELIPALADRAQAPIQRGGRRAGSVFAFPRG